MHNQKINDALKMVTKVVNNDWADATSFSDDIDDKNSIRWFNSIDVDEKYLTHVNIINRLALVLSSGFLITLNNEGFNATNCISCPIEITLDLTTKDRVGFMAVSKIVQTGPRLDLGQIEPYPGIEVAKICKGE